MYALSALLGKDVPAGFIREVYGPNTPARCEYNYRAQDREDLPKMKDDQRSCVRMQEFRNVNGLTQSQ